MCTTCIQALQSEPIIVALLESWRAASGASPRGRSFGSGRSEPTPHDPCAAARHAHVQRAVGRFVGGPFHDDDGRGGPGGWWIFVEVDVALGPHDIVRPDLADWRRERLPRPGAVRPIPIAPDWVCEVLSPLVPAARSGRAWGKGELNARPCGLASRVVCVGSRGAGAPSNPQGACGCIDEHRAD